MKRKIFLTLACISSFTHGALAHPGHGTTGTTGLLHYLVEWEHRWSIIGAVAIVAVIWGWSRLSSARRAKRGKVRR